MLHLGKNIIGSDYIENMGSTETIVVTNDGSNGYEINGSINPTLQFIRGNRYIIQVNAPTHPFFIQTIAGEYSPDDVYDGVTDNGTAIITVDVALNAPNALFYVSQTEEDMAGSISVSDAPPPPPPPVKKNVSCFSENAKILCYRNEEEVYVCIKDIRKGELVKTCADGYVKVDMIGVSDMNHSFQSEYKNQLYRLTPANYSGLFEDLILTGCHSILVKTLTDLQREKTEELLGKMYVTDNHYRLMTGIDEKSILLDKEGIYPIWHFALENDDYYKNYGVYANGLLVESCSQRMMKEYSGMTLL